MVVVVVVVVVVVFVVVVDDDDDHDGTPVCVCVLVMLMTVPSSSSSLLLMMTTTVPLTVEESIVDLGSLTLTQEHELHAIFRFHVVVVVVDAIPAGIILFLILATALFLQMSPDRRIDRFFCFSSFLG